jgi:hypothetical protein
MLFFSTFERNVKKHLIVYVVIIRLGNRGVVRHLLPLT